MGSTRRNTAKLSHYYWTRTFLAWDGVAFQRTMGENNHLFLPLLSPRIPKVPAPSHLALVTDTPKDFTPRWTLQCDVVLCPSSPVGSLSLETLPCPTLHPSSPPGLRISPGWRWRRSVSWRETTGQTDPEQSLRSTTELHRGIRSREGCWLQPAKCTGRYWALLGSTSSSIMTYFNFCPRHLRSYLDTMWWSYLIQVK